jgi:vacuolar-type H+-ATPase subunit I/STV1
MTFGEIKSIIEKNLLESYSNPANFKKTLKEFKHNILENKSYSKLYSLYDDLSTPKNLSSEDAKEYLEEGISLIRQILENVKLPKNGSNVENRYKDLDILVYLNSINIQERVQSKKNVLGLLMSKPKINENLTNIPLKSMVTIANQTIQKYLDTLDETTKKNVFHVFASNQEDLEKEFETLKENTVQKLSSLKDNESESDVVKTIKETIEKIQSEKFDQLNYVRLKQLGESIVLES